MDKRPAGAFAPILQSKYISIWNKMHLNPPVRAALFDVSSLSAFVDRRNRATDRKIYFFLRLAAARLARGPRTRLENKIVSQLDTRCIYADAPE